MQSILISLLSPTIGLAVITMLAATGLLFSERAGISNIGCEGMMLIGALMGYLGTYFTGNHWFGMLIAMASTALVAAVFAFFVITAQSPQSVVGCAINILGGGLTIMLNRTVVGTDGSTLHINEFKSIAIPFLSQIPVIGEVLFDRTAPVYISFVLIFLAQWFLFKTPLGLNIRAVGESPQACDTVGINVNGIKYGTVIFSGILAGMAGAYMSTAYLTVFTEGMVAGRGFMAMALVTFGNFNAIGIMFASLLFGLFDAIQYFFLSKSIDIPYQVLQMLPYILTILTLCGIGGKRVKPAASGQVYNRE